MKGLDYLDSIGGDLQIGYYKPSHRGSKEYDRGNKKLSNYCAIKNTKILGEINIKYNLFNPNFAELNDNCKTTE